VVLLSIIIPTFNRCELLNRALNSVYKQTYSDYEVIVIDDGSTDDTAEMLQKNFTGIRYVFQPNNGVSAARNKGLELAKGCWIAFLDSDDEWLPQKLEKQISLLKAKPDYKVCHTEEIWIRNGIRVNQMKKHKKTGGWIFPQCLPLCAMSPSSILIHHSVFDCIGNFDTSLPACEDYDLWLRIAAKYPVLYLEEPQIKKYGGHDDQLSKKHWGMDRYRIQALQNIISGGTLNNENKQKAISMLLKKCKVFQKGALKRGKMDDVQRYQNIINQFSEI
jgi:glycosyltransferase involved in cell wall biosynthesis